MNSNDTDKERLARIEAFLEINQKAVQNNGDRVDLVMNTVLTKIDALDAKMEARMQAMEAHASADAAELKALKARGGGFLAAIGLVFTATATVFADFFIDLKHYIFG